jgi:hypothetical protein
MIRAARFLRHVMMQPLFFVLIAAASGAKLVPGTASAAAQQAWTFNYIGPQVQHFTVPNV